jgi:hypothetical protein
MVTNLADRHQRLLIVESVLSTAAFYATSSRSPRAVTDTLEMVTALTASGCFGQADLGDFM